MRLKHGLHMVAFQMKKVPNECQCKHRLSKDMKYKANFLMWTPLVRERSRVQSSPAVPEKWRFFGSSGGGSENEARERNLNLFAVIRTFLLRSVQNSCSLFPACSRAMCVGIYQFGQKRFGARATSVRCKGSMSFCLLSRARRGAPLHQCRLKRIAFSPMI